MEKLTKSKLRSEATSKTLPIENYKQLNDERLVCPGAPVISKLKPSKNAKTNALDLTLKLDRKRSLNFYNDDSLIFEDESTNLASNNKFTSGFTSNLHLCKVKEEEEPKAKKDSTTTMVTTCSKSIISLNNVRYRVDCSSKYSNYLKLAQVNFDLNVPTTGFLAKSTNNLISFSKRAKTSNLNYPIKTIFGNAFQTQTFNHNFDETDSDTDTSSCYSNC